MINVCGEEEYIVSHLTSFLYVEIEGEIHETLFQAFETVHAVNVPPPEQKKTGNCYVFSQGCESCSGRW